MNKKVLWNLLLAVILLGSILIIVITYKAPKEVTRDEAYSAGSGLQIQQISDLQTESLYKLCKVWGYAKYHHPSVVAGSHDWDAELFRVIPDVLSARTEEETNAVLYRWLSGFSFEVNVTEEAKEWIETQKMMGFKSLDTGWIQDVDFLGEELCGYLERLSQTYIADRSNGYAANSDNPPYVSFENEIMRPFEAEDDGVKLLSLFRFWNIYQYYSPNIEITRQNWDEVLKEAIPEVISAGNYRDYVLAIASVASKTADAHIAVSDEKNTLWYYFGRFSLPCSFKAVDGQIVVDQSQPDVKGIQNGDILIAIDGVPMAQRIAELSQYTALPEPDKIVVTLKNMLLRTEKKEAKVRVIRNNEELELNVKTSESIFVYENPYHNGLMEQEQIGYIDPSALTDGDLQKLMVKFADTKGIIVDLRYYPSVFIPYLLEEYITPEPRLFTQLTYPNPAMPGSYLRNDIYSGAGMMKMMGDNSEYPLYRGKVILLMDETSVSQSEFTIMALRQSPNAIVVGSPSIGADGDVVKLSLPGGISMRISGLGVYTPEGNQTQRVGLKPDVECLPTVEGLRDGRDELIEKAVELIME